MPRTLTWHDRSYPHHLKTNKDSHLKISKTDRTFQYLIPSARHNSKALPYRQLLKDLSLAQYHKQNNFYNLPLACAKSLRSYLDRV